MVMIVYGSMAGVSVGGLFLAGYIPGILITGVTDAYIYLHSFRADFPELRQTSGKFSIKKLLVHCQKYG